ncbi:MAG: pantoate--beta-alanine ligase [Arcobacteraceae bacterium]
MVIIKSIAELQHAYKNKDLSVGFVPTMGSLHDGHISLIKKARENNDIVVVSIFLNPTQFLAGEDLDKYPKKDDADKEICKLCGVDYLFMPDISTMYSKDEVLIKAPKINSFILEGAMRPSHFDGVLQVVLKLFNIVRPTNVYFGKKDAQQLVLITQMVKNLYLDINIIPCEIIRESDGLAYSSRNVYLSKAQREESLKISQSINLAAKCIGKNQFDVETIKKEMISILDSDQFSVEYIAITNRKLQSIEIVELQNSIILVAIKIGNTRLIDNLWI